MEVHMQVMIPLDLYSEEEAGALKGVLHRRHYDEYPHTPLLLIVARKESKREVALSDQNEYSKTSKIVVESYPL